MTASQESLIESEIEFAQIVRRLVAERIGAEPDEIQWDDELTLLGVDSIALMSVLEWFLETHNRRVPYADAVAAGTLAGLVHTMSAQPEVHSPANSNVEIPQVNEHEPFGLSVMSQAYWAGQYLNEGSEPIVAHFYHEFDGENVDPARLQTACRLLLERNPMLRAKVNVDGTQQVCELPEDWQLEVFDLRDLSEPALEQRLDEIREVGAQENMDPASGEVFYVKLALLPQGKCRTYVKLYMGVADAKSFKMSLELLAKYYRTPQALWEPPAISYAQYITAVTENPDPFAEDDKAWWQEHLEAINAAPSLPAGEKLEKVRSRRYAYRSTPTSGKR